MYREHVREQHAKKFINNSFLSINTLKSMCKNEQKLVFDDSSVSSISQEFEIFIAISKQIFESTMIFEAIMTSKISHFLSNASKIVSKSMKNMLNQCFTVVICSFASIISQKTLKQVELIEQKTQKQIEIETTINSSVSSICLNFSIATLKIVSKSTKIASNQKNICVRAICKFCKQNFNFNEKLYEHIRNHKSLKLVKKFHFSINAVSLVCEVEKTSFASHKFSTSFAKFQKSIFEFAIAFRTVISSKRSNFSSFTFEIESKSTKKSITYSHYKRFTSKQKVE